jgi:hypothetical protein
MHIAIWAIAALFIGLWTLLAYGVNALLGLGTRLAGMPAGWYELLARMPAGEHLDDWLPGWREATVAAAQALSALLGWLGDAGPVLVWVVWGLGAAGLVLGAALLSGLVVLGRRAAAAAQPAAPAR